MRLLTLKAMVLIAFTSGCAEPKYQSVVMNPSIPEQSATGKANCQSFFSKQALCFTWFFEHGYPEAQKSTSLIVKFFRAHKYDESVVYYDFSSNTDFDVILWMPSMGHGSVPTTQERLDVGTYRINNVNFIMSGSWELYFNLTLNGESERLTYPLEIQ